MNITVKHKQVVAPVEKVTIELSLEEAQTLKLIANYRQRVADAVLRAEREKGRGNYLDFTDHAKMVSLLFGIFRTLHDSEVHASDRM
jgi:hypothetical protein